MMVPAVEAEEEGEAVAEDMEGLLPIDQLGFSWGRPHKAVPMKPHTLALSNDIDLAGRTGL